MEQRSQETGGSPGYVGNRGEMRLTHSAVVNRSFEPLRDFRVRAARRQASFDSKSSCRVARTEDPHTLTLMWMRQLLETLSKASRLRREHYYSLHSHFVHHVRPKSVSSCHVGFESPLHPSLTPPLPLPRRQSAEGRPALTPL